MGSRTGAVLERQRDGSYRGSFSLPAEVVYAAFAVEDVAATRTDSREGRFWELLLHDANGHPVFEALQQRFSDHMGRDELAVLETAREMVRLYPEHPAGWSSLRAAEGWVLGEQGAEEGLAIHGERLRAFDRALAEKRNLNADEVGYLYWYARVLQDEELTERWRERLLTEHPGHFFAVQERVLRLRREHREAPAALLRELEALWPRAEGRQARERIVGPAFTAARQVGDASTILVWADRYTSLDPSAHASVATSLSGTKATEWNQCRMRSVRSVPPPQSTGRAQPARPPRYVRCWAELCWRRVELRRGLPLWSRQLLSAGTRAASEALGKCVSPQETPRVRPTPSPLSPLIRLPLVRRGTRCALLSTSIPMPGKKRSSEPERRCYSEHSNPHVPSPCPPPLPLCVTDRPFA
jgi:hypothetical protein